MEAHAIAEQKQMDALTMDLGGLGGKLQSKDAGDTFETEASPRCRSRLPASTSRALSVAARV
jgi:hypothetical protein